MLKKNFLISLFFAPILPSPLSLSFSFLSPSTLCLQPLSSVALHSPLSPSSLLHRSLHSRLSKRHLFLSSVVLLSHCHSPSPSSLPRSPPSLSTPSCRLHFSPPPSFSYSAVRLLRALSVGLLLRLSFLQPSPPLLSLCRAFLHRFLSLLLVALSHPVISSVVLKSSKTNQINQSRPC